MSIEDWVTVNKTESIASLADPVLRNLQITQCYCALSNVFAKRMGQEANWCTFATWASKQAGQTIRREDLNRKLEDLLKKEAAIEAALLLLVKIAAKAGSRQSAHDVLKSVLMAPLATVANAASDAVSRGNKKVFEEIAREFARFMSACYSDTVYNQSNIDEFCGSLRSGPPPEGQEYLRKGFTAYYAALFETDLRRKTQLNLLANLCIGFHEQNRLQPEIAEALNAALPAPNEIRSQLIDQLFAGSGAWTRFIVFVKRIFGKKTLVDKAIESLIAQLQNHLRLVLTAHLMTLTLPPDNALRLGKDLTMPFPEHLKNPEHTDLIELLTKVDLTPDSTSKSGATDWANLKERMHYIADLFRCYHEYTNLFDEAFSELQTTAIMNGTIPDGKL